MESIESIKQRLLNCENNIKMLKEHRAPQHLIDNEEKMRKLILDNLKHRQENDWRTVQPIEDTKSEGICFHLNGKELKDKYYDFLTKTEENRRQGVKVWKNI